MLSAPMSHWLSPRTLRPSAADRWVRAFSTKPQPQPPPDPPTQTQSQPRQRHNNLSNLPVAAFKMNFRSLPYASPSEHLFPPNTLDNPVLTHHTPLFTLRAFPSPSRSSSGPRPLSPASHRHRPTPPPTLHHTTSQHRQPLLSPAEVLARERELSRLRKAYTMELTIMAGKAKVHKSAVVRERCKRRLREAVRLVVTRGAGAEQTGQEVVYDESHRGVRKWLLPGFMYIASIPSLELYRHPLPSLVSHVATALATIRKKAADKLLARDLSQIEVPPVATQQGAPGDPSEAQRAG